MTDPRYGRYSGPLVGEFLIEPGEDYRIAVLKELTFTDVQLPGRPEITVPEGFIADGATIPAWAWPFIGAPLTGDFRRASVIHDWECYLDALAPSEIHQRFYRAMRADGVGWFRAKVMYYAVALHFAIKRFRARRKCR